eukprot:467291_1
MAEAKQEIPVYPLEIRTCCSDCVKKKQVVSNADYHALQKSARNEAVRVKIGQVTVKARDPSKDPTAKDARSKLCRGAMLQARRMDYPQYNQNKYHSVPKGIYHLCKKLFPDGASITN